MNKYSGPNDPRFQSGSGFFEVIGLGAGVGAIVGYCAAWETVALARGVGLLTPSSIWSAIHQVGVFPPYLSLPLAVGAAFGLACGAGLGLFVGNISAEIHIRGSQLTRKANILQNAILAASPPVHGKNQGIRIHPKIQTTEALETSHLLIMGGSGAGKTTILWPMINQIIKRGDKAIIFSYKGDFEQKIGTGDIIGKQFALLAPWDNRSALWALGKDIRTRLDAEALAATLIPEPNGGSNDPMWINGSRSLIVGIVSDIQREYGEKWGFAELAKRISEALSDFSILRKIIEKESPHVANIIAGGAENRTTSSFLATVSSYMTNVINLGVAAHDLKVQASGKQWSVNRWLSDLSKIPKITILGFRPSAKALSQAFCASVIEQIVLKLSDLPDVSPERRRIWLILDEVPRLGKVPSITEALEVLRSKGVRLILGAQGIDQIEEVYSKNTARSWTTQTATKVFGRITDPESQRFAAGIIGEHELERYHRGSGSTDRGSYQRTKEHVVLPSQLGQILKFTRKGPRAIFQVAGSDHIVSVVSQIDGSLVKLYEGQTAA